MVTEIPQILSAHIILTTLNTPRIRCIAVSAFSADTIRFKRPCNCCDVITVFNPNKSVALNNISLTSLAAPPPDAASKRPSYFSS